MSNQHVQLTFKGGGWVLLLLAIVIISIITWAVAPAVLRLGNRAPGDGTNVSSYEFNLDNVQLPEESLVAVMQHRDMSPVLTNPTILSAEELAKKNIVRRNKFLVSGDLVIGVEIGGEVRTYPLHMLNVHEIVNDTLGGVPIVIYWNWLSGHIGVFERMVDNTELTFGLSGISGNGAMLIYPKVKEVGGEQLYSPILGQTVTGDLVHLKPITHEVVSWRNWFSRHPESTSLAPNEQFKKRYRKGDPRQYFLNDTIYFPVTDMPTDGRNPKTHIIVVQTKTGDVLYSIEELVGSANEDGVIECIIAGETVTFTVGNAPLFAVATDASGKTIPTQRSLWFTWFANHPGSVITSPTQE
jgi:hypothetical protein